MTIIADYLVLASGTSDRHVRAIADGVLYDIKEMGALPLRRDGNSEAGWIVLDTQMPLFMCSMPENENIMTWSDCTGVLR